MGEPYAVDGSPGPSRPGGSRKRAASWNRTRAVGSESPGRGLGLGHRTTQAELTRYLQRAGHPVEAPPDPVGPWAPGLAGRWHEAAVAWAARGCRYERALELALAPDAVARSEGRSKLEALGAAGALAALT